MMLNPILSGNFVRYLPCKILFSIFYGDRSRQAEEITKWLIWILESPLLRAGDSKGSQRHKGKVCATAGSQENSSQLSILVRNTIFVWRVSERQFGWQDFAYYCTILFGFLCTPGNGTNVRHEQLLPGIS